MAEGDGTSSGVGMGMIIGLLLVILVVLAGGFYMFGGRHAASNPVAAVADSAGHTVSGSVSVH
jgi:hypothetical protein